MSAAGVLLVGFLLGLKHATEADHLAAVATLATGQRTLARSVSQGVAWGLGHALTLFVVCGVVLALGHAIPPRLADALEFAVGLMLIALGVDVLRRVVRGRLHGHVHRHGGVRHFHVHGHAGDDAQHGAARGPGGDHGHDHEHGHGVVHPRDDVHHHDHDDDLHAHDHAPPLRALAVGMMHGMAGSAALVVLSLGATRSIATGLLYIALFGAGSIAGMALLSLAIALPLRWSARILGAWHRGLAAAVGAFSCGLGAQVLWRIGVEGGLFVG